MKKGILIALILVILVGLFIAFNYNRITGNLFLTNNNKEITIGFVGPLTGEIAVYGTTSKEGVQIAVDKINSEGGINGKKLNIIYEDDVCDKTNTINIINKFITMDNIDLIIGATCSGSVLAAAPIVESNRVLLFSPVSTNPNITYAGDYIFRNVISDDYIGEYLANFIYSNLNKKKVSIIYVNQDYGVGLYTKFKDVFEKIGGKVLISEAYDIETTKDFKSILVKMKDSNPDALVVISYGAEGGLIARQAKELGITIPIVGGDGFGTEPVLKSGGDALEGTLSAIPYLDETALQTKEFIAEYKARYNKDPTLLWASANAYDSIMLLKAGIEKYGVDPTKIKDYLYTIKDYPGVGGNTTFNKYGDVIKQVKIQVVKNGKFVTYQP